MISLRLIPPESKGSGYRKPLLIDTTDQLDEVIHDHQSFSNLSNSQAQSSQDQDDEQHQARSDTVLSTWGVGWQVPTLIIICYVLAIVIAGCHVALFLYINGKAADGPARVAPQSYVTTASYILASAFQYALKTALGVAYTQHLWHVLRRRAIRIWTIEALFSFRGNPFSLFRPAAIRASPILFVLALLSWALVIITSFPPGAISIRTESSISNGSATVPTFNASYLGNGSGLDAATYSLDTIWSTSSNEQGTDPSTIIPDFVTSFSLYEGGLQPVIQRLGASVLIDGRPIAIPSPCGLNCSYSITFDGPFFQCNTSAATVSLSLGNSGNGNPTEIYNGSYASPQYTDPTNDTSLEFTGASFGTITLTPIAISADDYSNTTLLVTQHNLTCIPFRAQYKMDNTFENGVQSFNVSLQPIQQLIRLSQYNGTFYPQNAVHVPGFSDPTRASADSYGTTPANWSEHALHWYRDLNLINIVDSVASSLAGNYVAPVFSSKELDGQMPNETLSGHGDVLWYKDVKWADQIVPGLLGPFNGTIIQYTKLNTVLAQRQPLYAQGKIPSISFNVTPEILNSALLNLTLSIIPFYDLWNTTVPTTTQSVQLIYNLSDPLALFLPYFLSLLLALPFIILGGRALHANGVSAMDGGFVQLVTTSTGSTALERHSAGACLGGSGNVSRDLKELKVRYGEIIEEGRQDRDGVVIRRAGFGTEEEIVPLVRGSRYGFTE